MMIRRAYLINKLLYMIINTLFVDIVIFDAMQYCIELKTVRRTACRIAV